ncbi:MAG: toll/interleukin-1 receptor domain-containing protein [Clostridia bacterium]|nr:toll/interleukin-1 receptor domain-containing protein [Clostridia bacterium]
MALFKCKMCGGDLEVTEGAGIAICGYCGTKQTLPGTADENMQNIFNRANTLRIKSEFDKAEKLYERIIQSDSAQAEAYWGLILCKYGIEYVDDPATFKKIPTCHRASYDSIIADDDYKSAIKNADSAQRTIYEEQAKEIDRIQKEILALAQKEERYDVFICYKETDSEGRRTQDSVIANDIYHQLTAEGFKVFYAAITLEGKLGSAYEPVIFAALHSAKVMLSIGTRPEYFNAVWVKNEWSRFLKIIKNDRTKLLIPCYRDMDAYELPEEFAHLQAQDMSKIGFINDIVRGIKKVISKDEPKPAVIKETVVTADSTQGNVTALLKRGYMALEDGEWNKADDFFEQTLNQNAELAEAYLGKLMAELKIRKKDSLKDMAEPFNNSNNYQKAIRFADTALKTELEGYIEHINTRNENARMEGIYTRAKKEMSKSYTEKALKNVASYFNSISSYKDSAELAKQCLEKAEESRKDEIIYQAKSKMSAYTISECKAALSLLESVPGWKNADTMTEECKKIIAKIQEVKEKEAKRREQIAKRNKRLAGLGIATGVAIGVIIAVIVIVVSVWNSFIIPIVKYNKAVGLMKDGEYTQAISAFEAMNGYKDSTEKIGECKTAIIDEKYNAAIELIDSGNIIEAYDALIALDGYKDSAQKASSIYDEYKTEKLKNVKVGDYVFFGAYEQDNNTFNGKEVVEWLVLDVKDGKALVISKYALNSKPYISSYNFIVAWESCSLREWLNDDFINAAFSAVERAMIPTVTVSADKNPSYDTDPGNETQDKVFLLSITEANKYFSSDSARECEPTDYAVANGAYVSDYNGNCSWWLRTPGIVQFNVAYIYTNGDVHGSGYDSDNDYYAVRPAMWIEIPE